MEESRLRTVAFVARRFNDLQGLRVGVPVGLPLAMAGGIGAYLGKVYFSSAMFAGYVLAHALRRFMTGYYAARFGVVVPAAPASAMVPQFASLDLGAPPPLPLIAPRQRTSSIDLVVIAAFVLMGLAGLWSDRSYLTLGRVLHGYYLLAAAMFLADFWFRGEHRLSQAGSALAGAICVALGTGLANLPEEPMTGLCLVCGLGFVVQGLLDHLLLVRVLGRGRREEPE